MKIVVNFASISRENDVNGVVTFLHGFRKLSQSFNNNGVIINKIFLYKSKRILENTGSINNNPIRTILVKVKQLMKKTYILQLLIFNCVYIFRPISMSIKIFKHYKKNASEIIFYNDIFIAFFSNLILRKSVKKILILHSSEHPLNQVYILFPVLNNFACKYLLNKLLNNALNDSDQIITLTNKFEGIIPLKHGNVSTIYNTCFIEDYQNQLLNNNTFNKNEFSILCIGSLQYRKGFDLIIKSLANIGKNKLPKIRISIAGDGPEKTYLKELIKNNKLENNVLLLGNVENISDLIINNDIFYMPSRDEGLSIALVESMCLAKPIFTTRAGSVAEIFKDDECYYVEANESSITLSLNNILDNNIDLSKLSSASLNVYNNKLSNKIFISKYSEIFKRVSKIG